MLVAFSIALISIVTYRTFFNGPASDPLYVETYRISGGWGYKILLDDRVYIDQPFVPGLPGKKPFPDRRSALQAGKMVRTRLAQGRIPRLTREDLPVVRDSVDGSDQIEPLSP